MWALFQHGADIGVRGNGDSPARAFEQAALAMTAVITEPERVQCLEEIEVRCQAPDLELLLVDWLNALVYEMAVRGLLLGHFQVSIDGHELHGLAWGEPVDVQRHQPAVEVKGATLTELQVRETAPGHWLAQCVVDV
ncbi:archease [Gallaecimonas sp. GXIMD4217]|uniref:archease n=1 Tax=Gallaecimonas sp. GXIMD4217 TaxID=3131927 RepID=UPI00311B428D